MAFLLVISSFLSLVTFQNSLSTIHFTEQWRRRNATKEEGEEQVTLRGGNVWLAVETTKASGNLRELLGRWTAILLIFPLFLEELLRFSEVWYFSNEFFSLQKYVFCGQIGLSVDNWKTKVSCCLQSSTFFAFIKP